MKDPIDTFKDDVLLMTVMTTIMDKYRCTFRHRWTYPAAKGHCYRDGCSDPRRNEGFRTCARCSISQIRYLSMYDGGYWRDVCTNLSPKKALVVYLQIRQEQKQK